MNIFPRMISLMKQEAFNRVKDQMGPCGISCGGCSLGNGTVGETAEKLKQFIQMYGVAEWAPLIPGGFEVDFEKLDHSLDWIHTYTSCPGCEHGGGPPDCSIRSCAKERGFELCSQCSELEECGNFQWLGEGGEQIKMRLAEARGKTKSELISEAVEKL